MAEYKFADVETGEVIGVGFAEMMGAKDGFLFRDGRTYRRVREKSTRTKCPSDRRPPKIVSDALGFGAHQLEEFEADRKVNKLRGVEFHPDPTEPGFIQAHFDSEDAKARYMRHRGAFDKNSKNGSGAMLSESHLEWARRKARNLD